MELIISIGDAADVAADRNVITSIETSTSLANLYEEDSGANGSVGFEIVAGRSGAVISIGSGDVQGSGSASWVLPWMNRTASPDLSSSVIQCKLSGLPAGEYVVEVYGIASFGDGVIASEVFSLDKLTHSIVENTTLTNRHAAVEPNAQGEILFDVYEESGGNTHWAVARVYSVDTSPSLALDNPPQLGATLSGTYANFGGTPTGPIQFDQGARSLPDEAITVTSGTESWVTDTALPGLPANGASVTPFPLIGENITITLPDPGA